MFSEITSTIYEFDGFRLVPDERLLLNKGSPVNLNPKAFAVLVMLVENHGHLVTKAEMLDVIWEGAFVEEGAIAKAVWFARNALGDGSKGRYINTVPRRGYRFIAPVSVIVGSGAFRLADLTANDIQPEVRSFASGQLEISAGNEQTDAVGAASFPAQAGRRAVRWKFLQLAILTLILLTASSLIVSWAIFQGPPQGDAVRRRPIIRSIALLPLQNLSGEDQEHIVHGIASSLNRILRGSQGLTVTFHPSKADNTSPETLNNIARAHTADAVIIGTVSTNDSGIVVAVTMWSVESQKIEWAKQFEGRRDEISGLPATIAAQLLSELGIAEASAVSTPLPSHPRDAAAEDAYFKGEYYFDAATNSSKAVERDALFSKAISEFEKAIAADSQFAEAYASLARTYHWLGSTGRPEAYVKSKEAALSAIDLDPSNAKAHASLAWINWRHEWNWAQAETNYKRALSLGTGPAGPLGHGYALFISAQGRHEEAIKIIRKNEESSPLSLAAKVSSAMIKLRARKFGDAEIDFRRVLELDPSQTSALSGLALTLVCSGRIDEAIMVARRAKGSDDNPAQRMTLAWVYAKAGRDNEARAILRNAERQFLEDHSRNDPYAIAKVYAGLGESDKAFEWLERAFAVRSQYLVFMGVSPEFDDIKGDPRFAEMLKRLGMSLT